MTPAAAPPPLPSATINTTSAAANTTLILGKYQLGRLLGRGSFAKVYHGRNLQTAAAVAVKVIDKSKANGVAMEQLILREIAAMRRLNHPNVLRIHEVLATKSKIYLVMDLAKGGDLFNKLANRRPDHRFPEPLARRYFHQLISALHYCHQNGVAHRDVKPQNLLLDQEGNIKVSDFGLSAVVEDQRIATAKDNSLLLRTACGTPAFAAPEIMGRRGYDGCKADAWSCGVILFVMLCGYLPFDDSNLANMYRKIYKREFRFPSWVSRPAKSLIHQLLDPNPNSRLSIERIKVNSWFKVSTFCSRSISLGDLASMEEKKLERSLSMNAFDIISMSSGLNLNGFFDGGVKRERRFTARETVASTVVEKVVEVGGKLGYEVEKGKGGRIWLGKGRWVVAVAVLEVVPEVLMVELAVVDGGGGVMAEWDEVHWGELKSGLGEIAVQWHNEDGM